MYTMKEVCRQTGMTYEALKFYCNEGLVPNVKRDANNHRIFDDRDVAWIKSLTCLKNCGMSIQDSGNEGIHRTVPAGRKNDSRKKDYPCAEA